MRGKQIRIKTGNSKNIKSKKGARNKFWNREGNKISEDNFVSSIKESELKEGHMKAVQIKGRPILLVRHGGGVFGILNRCPHMGCTFEGGILRDYIVMCPCHGWKFDVRNGQYTENPQTTLQTYRCRIEKGKIYVEMRNKNSEL